MSLRITSASDNYRYMYVFISDGRWSKFNTHIKMSLSKHYLHCFCLVSWLSLFCWLTEGIRYRYCGCCTDAQFFQHVFHLSVSRLSGWWEIQIRFFQILKLCCGSWLPQTDLIISFYVISIPVIFLYPTSLLCHACNARFKKINIYRTCRFFFLDSNWMVPILSAGTGTDIDNVNALKLKYSGHNVFF
jgi:hypothetical protein